MRRMITTAMLLILFCIPVRAELNIPELEGVWQQAEAYGIEEGESLEEGMISLLTQVPSIFYELMTAGMRTAVKLLAVVLVCSLAQGMEEPGKSLHGLPAVRSAGALAITALTMTDVASMIGLGQSTVARMDFFSAVLLPAMAVITAVTGGITAAAARQGVTVLFSKLLVSVMDTIFVPMVYAYVVVCCGQAIAGNQGLEKLAQGIKSMVTGFLTALLLVFVGYLTASGAIAGSVDVSRVKAAKMAISRVIPVVGGILADASETVLAGASALRGSVGAAGMLVVLAICLTPFLHLAVQYMIYKGTAAICAVVAQPELAKLIDAIGSAFGLILGMTGAAALILLVSVVAAVLSVTG